MAHNSWSEEGAQLSPFEVIHLLLHIHTQRSAAMSNRNHNIPPSLTPRAPEFREASGLAHLSPEAGFQQ